MMKKDEMITNLITTLFYLELGNYAVSLYDAMRSKQLTLSMFAEMYVTLHRLSLCGYYDLPDDEYRTFLNHDRYWELFSLCDNGGVFALLCLQKMVADHIAVKQGALVTVDDSTLDLGKIREQMIATVETLGDEDGSMGEWVDDLDALIAWQPGNNSDYRLKLLDVMDPSNADIIFGLCAGFDNAPSLDRLRKRQRRDPEDFPGIGGILDYYERMISSLYCYSFMEQADMDEMIKVRRAEVKAQKASSIRELLFAISEMDVYLNREMTFPYTVYQLLTDEQFTV